MRKLAAIYIAAYVALIALALYLPILKERYDRPQKKEVVFSVDPEKLSKGATPLF